MKQEYPENLIIHKPHERTSGQKTEDSLLFFIMVGIWAIILPSAITWLVWCGGLFWIEHELLTLNGIGAIIQNKLYILKWIIILTVSLLAWATIQWIRFKGVERRKEHRSADIVKISEYLGVSVDFIVKARNSSIVKFEFDDDGNIIESKSSAKRKPLE